MSNYIEHLTKLHYNQKNNPTHAYMCVHVHVHARAYSVYIIYYCNVLLFIEGLLFVINNLEHYIFITSHYKPTILA